MLLAALAILVEAARRSQIAVNSDHALSIARRIQEDVYCSSLSTWVSAAFCDADLPRRKTMVMRDFRRVQSGCKMRVRAHSVPLALWQRTADTAWTATSRHKQIRNSNYEVINPIPLNLQTMPISQTDYFENYVSATVDHCDTHYLSGNWTLERVGPFSTSGGHRWLSAGWVDAGDFGSRLEAGDIYLTAFGFFPMSEYDHILGRPPIHIHHMHVSSSQSWGRNGTTEYNQHSHLNSLGNFAIEFDTHGDRQCPVDLGGTDCLMRAFPEGFGLQFVDPVETFFDLVDIRSSSAPELILYAHHAYRWMHFVQRRVGKVVTGIIQFGINHHDDYPLILNLNNPTSYVIWATWKWLLTGSLVQMYWHTHHLLTRDVWIISAHSSEIGIAKIAPLPQTLTNMTALGYSIDDTMLVVAQNVFAAQKACATASCLSWPAIRCTLNQDRWETLSDGSLEGRYRSPQCPQWDVTIGQPYTLVAFHAPATRGKAQESLRIWMHAVFYAFIVQANASFGDTFSLAGPRGTPGQSPYHDGSVVPFSRVHHR